MDLCRSYCMRRFSSPRCNLLLNQLSFGEVFFMSRHPSFFHYPYLCNVACRYLTHSSLNPFAFLRNLFTAGNSDFMGLYTSRSYDRLSRLAISLLFILRFCQLAPRNEDGIISDICSNILERLNERHLAACTSVWRI